MDEKDKKYFEEYSKLINKYSKTQSLVDLNLAIDFYPPNELYLEVRAMDDFEYKDKTGSKTVKKNESYFLKRSEIEIYIRQGLFKINE